MTKSVKALFAVLWVMLFFACDMVPTTMSDTMSDNSGASTMSDTMSDNSGASTMSDTMSDNSGARGFIAEARETIENLESDNPIHTKAENKFRPRLEVLENALVTYQADKDIDKLLDAVNIFEEHYREFKRTVERSRGRSPEDAARILELRSLLFIGLEYYEHDVSRDTEYSFTFFAKDSDSDFIIFDSEVSEEYLWFVDKFREGQYPASLAIINSPEADQAHERADVAIQAQRHVIEDSIDMLDELSSFYTGEFFSSERSSLKNAKEALEELLTFFYYCDGVDIWSIMLNHERFRWSLENKYFEHSHIMFYFMRYWQYVVGL